MERAPIDQQRLQAACAPRWQRIEVVDTTGSTNADLLADEAAPEGSVLVAEYQSAARGRRERVWTSPPRGGLSFSVLLRPDVPIAAWGWLPLLAGIALHDAVSEAARVPVALKWPNDLLAGTEMRKVAGILAQTSGEAVVIGIGVNVAMSADELPVEDATSLQLCGAASLDRTALLIDVLTQLDTWLLRWSQCDGDALACGLAGAYRGACATVGKPVTVTATDGSTITGVASTIEPDGRLRVVADGTDRVIGAGDVEHLRPAAER